MRRIPDIAVKFIMIKKLSLLILLLVTSLASLARDVIRVSTFSITPHLPIVEKGTDELIGFGRHRDSAQYYVVKSLEVMKQIKEARMFVDNHQIVRGT